MKPPLLRRRSALAFPLAAVLVLAACGSDDSASTDTTARVETDAPTTTADDEDAAATSDYLGSYSLMDEEFGTMTKVTVDGSTRTIETNTLPDHETGEFPNEGNPNTISAQDASYQFPHRTDLRG
jgi:hypothetical protein